MYIYNTCIYVINFYKTLNYIAVFRTIYFILFTFALTSENSQKNLRNKGINIHIINKNCIVKTIKLNYL